MLLVMTLDSTTEVKLKGEKLVPGDRYWTLDLLEITCGVALTPITLSNFTDIQSSLFLESPVMLCYPP